MKKLVATAFIVSAAATAVFSQDPLPPIDINTLTPSTVFDTLVEPLYGALVILFGYLSAYIPGVKNWSPFYRVAAFALAAGLGSHLFGVSFWKIASSYFLSSGLYAVILKNIFPSKKAPANG